jgi:hypothetical protein
MLLLLRPLYYRSLLSVNYSHQNKGRKNHINVFPEVGGFLTLIERLHSTGIEVTLPVPSLITVEFLLFIKSQ